MKIAKDTVVSVAYKLSDAHGNLIEESDEPMVYLHGGYDGTFPKIEEQLDGQEPGYQTQIQLEPQDAFGDYDPELVETIARRCTETSSGGRNVEKILSSTLLPELSADVLARLGDGRPVSRLHVAVDVSGEFSYTIN